MKMKERWFNFRPLCLVFGFLLLGSVFSFFIMRRVAITLIFSAVVLAILIVIAILKKKIVYLLVPMLAFIVGICAYNLSVLSFNKSVDSAPNIIEARIYNVSNEKNGVICVEADSCIFDGKKNNDNIIIYIYDNDGLFEHIDVGSVIKFKPYRFYKSDLFNYETPNSRLYANDLKYTVSARIDDVQYIKTDKTFSEHIKEKINENLSKGLTNENTEIAFSALFGDKDLLSDKQYSVYKLSGVAHLLAVSGLHVGIIVAIFNAICKLFKVKKWYKFGLISIFLLFYIYICGYSVSVIRASVMSLIFMLACLLGREYDPFNSISIAGILIYIINPLCIFDVSFLLSFSCAIGITMLYAPIYAVVSKSKMPKKIGQSVSISLATTISIVFIMAYYFKTLNIISILSNVILIPIFTIGFTAVFVLSLMSLFFPCITYLLYPINYIFDFINLVATTLGNLSISNFNTIEFNFIAIVIYFVLLLFMGRFCTAKYQYKIISTLPILAILFYCLL